MSYIEFFGTLLNLWSVWLVTKNNIWTWPVGNVAVLLFALLFYQIHLYSDLIEQFYFLVTGFYGWWAWAYYRKSSRKTKEMHITQGSLLQIISSIIIIIIFSVIMGYGMSHINEFLPKLFPEPASYPYLDAFTTVMSFVANIFMAYKKIECWILWITVDVIGIGLYYTKGVVFVSLLYVIFLLLALKGLINWKKIFIQEQME